MGSLSFHPMIPATCFLRLRNNQQSTRLELGGGTSDSLRILSKYLIKKYDSMTEYHVPQVSSVKLGIDGIKEESWDEV